MRNRQVLQESGLQCPKQHSCSTQAHRGCPAQHACILDVVQGQLCGSRLPKAMHAHLLPASQSAKSRSSIAARCTVLDSRAAAVATRPMQVSRHPAFFTAASSCGPAAASLRSTSSAWRADARAFSNLKHLQGSHATSASPGPHLHASGLLRGFRHHFRKRPCRATGAQRLCAAAHDAPVARLPLHQDSDSVQGVCCQLRWHEGG
jgi:hypothetical protein